MKFYLSFFLTIYVSSVLSQTNNSMEVVHGCEKYIKEVVGICESYSKVLDSLQNDRIQKYKGNDGGLIGHLMNEEDKKMETIVNRFLKIDRISSSYTRTDKNGLTEYGFKYYRTVKDHNGIDRLIYGVVIWVDDSKVGYLNG